jgi:hypothetical protein
MHRTYSMRQSRAPTASQIQSPPPPSSSTKAGRFFGKANIGTLPYTRPFGILFSSAFALNEQRSLRTRLSAIAYAQRSSCNATKATTLQARSHDMANAVLAMPTAIISMLTVAFL